MKPGKMIIISGPSGVGKGSVNNILRNDKKLNLEYSVSMTTRQARNGEVDGAHYFFVSKEEFAKAIVDNQLIEHASFVGNFYGTPRKYVDQQIAKGKNIILEIEVDGATQVLRNEKNVLSIFLMPPSLEELANRIRGRKTESEETLQKRLDKAILEIPLKHNYEYVVENDTVENAVAKITDILELEDLTTYTRPTVYFQLKQKVYDIVTNRYLFFVENWQANQKLATTLLKEESLIIENKDDAKASLVDILTNNLYRQNLAHGHFQDLLNKEYVEERIERLMLEIDFFSIGKK